jgi:hypothetical protein
VTSGEGPYVVTVTRACDHREGGVHRSPASCQRCGGSGALGVASRRAFATLAGASGYADDRVARYFYGEYEDRGKELPAEYFELSTAARELPAEGGTVGPLPDGTVVEVAASEWAFLAGEAGFDLKLLRHLTERQIVDRWNETKAAAQEPQR